MNVNVEKFKNNGYVLIKNAISEDISNILTQYAVFDEVQNFSPDGHQVPNAHSKYADPAMESLLMFLLPLIEKNTDLELYPTYSFYRVYRRGDVLSPHTDRESCEISATLCLGYSYNDEEYSWPIIIDGNEIAMSPGDLVIYKGIDLEHERKEFSPPDNDCHIQTFLHYVNANGIYKDFIYDKRENVGLKKTKKIEKSSDKKYLEFL